MTSPDGTIVRVFNHAFMIHKVSRSLMDDKMGWIDPAALIIYYVEGMPLSQEADTIFHEILHAVYEAMALKDGETDEERIVRAFTTGILNVWKDNPQLFAWIYEAGLH